MTFLDKSVINRFRSKFVAASFLHEETEYKRISSLGSAFLKRMDIYIDYLNEHSKLPLDDIDIVLFFVLSCWILDGVNMILSLLCSRPPCNAIYLPSPVAEKILSFFSYSNKLLINTYNDIISKDQLASKRYFRINVDCRTKVDCNLFSSDSEVPPFTVKIRPLYGPDMCKSMDKCPCLLKKNISDDKFFEYLRSLIFAHPFETNRSSIFQEFQEEKDVQVSPFTVSDSYLPLADFPSDDGIAVWIYSGSDWSIDRCITFSFSALKNYICSRYSLINNATERIQQISDEREFLWKQHHVNRDLQPIAILNDIKQILDERYVPHVPKDLIDKAIEYLSCEITVGENEDIIQKYRDKIISIIPTLCDAADEMNYEEMVEQLHDVLEARPEHMHERGHYQLEKIFNMSESNHYSIRVGLDEAENFAKKFAKDWVTLKPDKMNFCEIQLVVSIACYFERMAQMEKQIT